MRLTFFYTLIGFVCLFSVVFSAEEQNVTSDRATAKNETDMPITLASILEAKPNPQNYKARRQCISKAAIKNHDVLSKRHILFTMHGKSREKILVQFGRHCFGLHRQSIINLESKSSSRLCVGDYVRTEVFEFGRRSWGPRCTIPAFETITDYQVELLQLALVTGRVE